MLQMNR